MASNKKNNTKHLGMRIIRANNMTEAERIQLAFQAEERAEREERGKAFQKARESAGLSRNAMARLAGISASTLKKYELGLYIRRPRLVEKALANALEIERLRKVFGVLVNQLPSVLRHIDSSRPRLHWMH